MSKRTVILSVRAEQDRESAFQWYRQNFSPAFAGKWIRGLSKALRSIGRSPQRSAVARESVQAGRDVREFLYHAGSHQNHRVLFVLEPDKVVVLHIRHASRDDPSVEELL
jgi:plasmid stabilization system protein ParE